MTPLPNNGLYAITDSKLTPVHTLLQQVNMAIRGGARVIQYRDKTSSAADKLNLAGNLLNLCRQANVPLIINDDISLAKAIAADGVHLGADDTSINEARKLLGQDIIIGISCYNDYQQALVAQNQGANYIAFGRFYPSTTKPLAIQASIDLLRQAKRSLHIPIVAIGGITTENGSTLVEAGADFLAVVAGVFASNDPEISARQYAEIYYNQQNKS